MAVSPVALNNVFRNFYSWLRELSYSNMAHQATDWAPGTFLANRAPKAAAKARPITINFKVAKKNRLRWSSSYVRHLPHLVGRTF